MAVNKFELLLRAAVLEDKTKKAKRNIKFLCVNQTNHENKQLFAAAGRGIDPRSATLIR